MATVHGVKTQLVVDTGSSISEVDSGLAASAHLKKVGSTITLDTVSCKVTAQPVTLDKVVVGSITMPTVTGTSTKNEAPAAASKDPINGLLGADVLSTFGTVTVDYKNMKVTLGG